MRAEHTTAVVAHYRRLHLQHNFIRLYHTQYSSVLVHLLVRKYVTNGVYLTSRPYGVGLALSKYLRH